MPGHTIKGVAIFLFTSSILFAGIYYGIKKDENGRAPASLSQKELILGEVRGPALKHTAKLRGPLEASIELVGAKPEQPGDVFVLRGEIRTDREVSGAEFQWDIPAGVEVVNGANKGSVALIKGGQSHFVEITLRALNDQNEQVHFVTNGALADVRFADSAQYNTRHQEALDKNKEAMLKSTEEYSGGKIQPKIFH